MEFDDRLHRAFDALADSLHQEISAQLAVVRADLSGTVQADQDAAVAEAVRGARTATDQEVTRRVEECCRSRRNRRAFGSGCQPRGSGLGAWSKRFARLTVRRGLSEILDVLIAAAEHTEVGRAAVFLPQATTLKSWRLIGFDRRGR